MKQRLLLLAGVLLASAATFASSWVKPTVPESDYKTLTAGDTVYVYNVGAGQFLSEGADWGTHAIVADKGALCVLLPYTMPGASEWDGVTYKLRDLSPNYGNWQEYFIEEYNGSGVWANGIDKENFLFNFVQVSGNTYRITASPLNNSAQILTDKYMGNDVDYHDAHHDIYDPTGVVYGSLDVEETFRTIWAFISPDAYAAYLNRYAAWEKAVELEVLIATAKEQNVDTSAAEQILSNTSATADELSATIAALYKSLGEAEESNVLPDNPVDKTALILNPGFEGSIDGWINAAEISTFELGTWSGKIDGTFFTGSNYLNLWHANGVDGVVAFQTVNDLPNGVYAFTAAAYSDAAGGYVFAGDKRAAITANAANSDFTLFVVVDNHTLDIGYYSEHTASFWSCFDNVRLTYYGGSDESYAFYLAKILETMPYQEGDIVCQSSVANAWEDLLVRANAATTRDEVLAIVPLLESTVAEVSASVAAYAAFAEAFAQAQLALEQVGTSAAVFALEDYLDAHADDIENGELTAAEILAQVDALAVLVDAALKGNNEPGTDCTRLIVNPDFSDGLNGWTVSNGKVETFGNGDEAMAQAWNNNFVVSQQIEGVSNGIYQLDFKGFGRTGNSETSWSNASAPVPSAYAIVGGTQTAFVDYATASTGNAELYPSAYSPAEGVYLPTTGNDFNIAFANDLYSNTAYGIVTDGVLRIGFCSPFLGATPDSWAIFTDLSLTYQGEEPAVMQAALTQVIEQVKLLQRGHVAPDAVATANDAVAVATSLEPMQAYASLLPIIDALQASHVNYNQLYASLDRLQAAYDAYSQTASLEAFEAIGNLYSELLDAYDNNSFTDAEVLSKLAEVDQVIAAARIPQGMDQATDDNPVLCTSLIDNPTFDKNISGWYNEGDSKFVWRGTGDSFERSMQVYSDWSKPIGHSDVAQVLAGVPAGGYILSFDWKMAASDWSLVNTYSGCYVQVGDKITALTNVLVDSWSELEHATAAGNADADGILLIRFFSDADATPIWWVLDNLSLSYCGPESVVGINDITPSTQPSPLNSKPSTKIYNLAGQRLSKLQKGVNIINGKKVIIK